MVPVVAMDCFDFDYYKYYFYSRPRKQKGMTIIKYPLYRFFVRDDDAVGFLAIKDRERKPRADTI